MNEKPICVAVALILNDGCVLMGERSPEKIYPLHWEFPGGKIERGETAIQALRRELHEELGIEVVDPELWDSNVALYSNGMIYAISYFLVRAWNGEIINREFNRIAWISSEMLPTLLHLSGNEAILQRLMQAGIPS
jgi:8-oxo-dGTP diphosphatase